MKLESLGLGPRQLSFLNSPKKFLYENNGSKSVTHTRNSQGAMLPTSTLDWIKFWRLLLLSAAVRGAWGIQEQSTWSASLNLLPIKDGAANHTVLLCRKKENEIPCITTGRKIRGGERRLAGGCPMYWLVCCYVGLYTLKPCICDISAQDKAKFTSALGYPQKALAELMNLKKVPCVHEPLVSGVFIWVAWIFMEFVKKFLPEISKLSWQVCSSNEDYS